MNNIIPFPDMGERESDRIKAIHIDRISPSELSASMGTPEEWLASAISHCKVQFSEARNSGTVEISSAALHLILMRIEQIDHDGQPITLA